MFRDKFGRFAGKLGTIIFKYYKRLCLIELIAVIALLLVLAGTTQAHVEYQRVEVVVEDTSLPAVMQRIAECESGDSHYGQSGQVLMLPDKIGGTDVGRFQINTQWFKIAHDLGYDLTDEKQNTEFAMYLYKNFGTEPWVYSKKCWNR